MIFKGTQYEMRKWFTCTFYVLLTAYFIANQTLSASWLILVFDLYSWADFVTPYYLCLGAKLGIDLLMNIFLIYVFVSNIIKVTAKARAQEQQAISHKCHGALRHNHSMRIFGVMIRYFILSCFTIASTALFTASELILSVAIEVAVKTDEYTFYRIWYCVYFILYNVDALVSAFFLLLSFSFTQKLYRICCGSLDSKCTKIWKGMTAPKDSKLMFIAVPSDTRTPTSKLPKYRDLRVKSPSSRSTPSTTIPTTPIPKTPTMSGDTTSSAEYFGTLQRESAIVEVSPGPEVENMMEGQPSIHCFGTMSTWRDDTLVSEEFIKWGSDLRQLSRNFTQSLGEDLNYPLPEANELEFCSINNL